jgi:hypothetical protein
MRLLMAELPAQLAEAKSSRRLSSDTKKLHGQTATLWIGTRLEPTCEPAELQLKQQANQLIDLR